MQATRRWRPARLLQHCKWWLRIYRASGLILLIAACVVASSAPNTHAQLLSASEYEIKAALLFNFANFVEWPAQAFPEGTTSITFGVLSENPFGKPLDSLKNKTLNGRKLVIKYFKNARELEFCHVLFIASSEKKHVEQILQRLDGWSVLTIGETELFTQLGGMINFTVVESKVQFEINMASAERAGLKISSKLLALATIVTDERP